MLGGVVGVETLHFNVILVIKSRAPLTDAFDRLRHIAFEQSLSNIAQMRARQGNQTQIELRMLGQPLRMNLPVRQAIGLQIRLTEQIAQTQITRTIFHQQQHAVRLNQITHIGHPDVRPHDRLHACALRRFVKLNQTKSVAQVCQGKRTLLIGRSKFHCIFDARDAILDRKLGVQTEVDKRRLGHVCFSFEKVKVRFFRLV